MRFLIQRVTSASVALEGKTVGEIGRGFLVFIGISKSDIMETPKTDTVKSPKADTTDTLETPKTDIVETSKTDTPMIETGNSIKKSISATEMQENCPTKESSPREQQFPENSRRGQQFPEKYSMEIAEKMTRKLLGLRIFEDENGKTNLDLKSVGGSLLMISQFTLYADCRKGNRPSFTNAGDPEKANLLYRYIVDLCRQFSCKVEEGIFGADMKVELVNDGPFTVLLDSDEIMR